ncbi:lipoprotein 17-related variable surface protein [Mycoplasmopsis gallinacea]|uniref:ECM-binding protein homolog n=1 Tax=Mycoplasmopsis gallinacea TaxID=29556 RepID=A0A6H0V2F1_9BACT|nr:lipoprotein 17-related variable surface protein [Mycoplasmopsis gallinacea]QIW62372.1 hypothetical protein GOQ20_02975 [Mycoplasmopsis gallinacea]
MQDYSVSYDDNSYYTYEDYDNNIIFKFKVESFITRLDLVGGGLDVDYRIVTQDLDSNIETNYEHSRNAGSLLGLTWQQYLDILTETNDTGDTLFDKNAGRIEPTYDEIKRVTLPSEVDLEVLYKNTHISDTLLSYWGDFKRKKMITFNDKDGTYEFSLIPELFAPENFTAERFPNPYFPDDRNKDVVNKLKWIDWAENDFRKISYRQESPNGPKTFIYSNLKPSDYYGDTGFKMVVVGFKTEAQRLDEEWVKITNIKLGTHVISDDTSADNSVSNASWITFDDAKNPSSYSFSGDGITGANMHWTIESDEASRTITLKYKLESTRQREGNFTGDVFSSNERTITISGFPSEGQPAVESQQKDDIENLTPTFTADSKKQASYFDTNKEEISRSVTQDAESKYNRTVNILEVLGYDDATGKLKVKYRIESTPKDKPQEAPLSSRKKTAEIEGYLTEKQRIQNIKDSLSNESIWFNGDKKQTSPSSVDKSNITPKDLSSDNATMTITSISGNDKDGTLTTNYDIKSSKTVDQLYKGEYATNGKDVNAINNTAVSGSESLTGFKTEAERLDKLTTNLDYTDKEVTMPSATNKESVTNDLGNDQNAKVVIDSIEEANDGSGTIKFKYHFESTKDGMTGVVSSSKEATINGFKTEKQRLNELNATLDYTNKSTTMPSGSNADSITKALPNGSAATVVIDSIEERNDKDGSIKVKYHLVSSKNGMTNIVSESKEGTITGFKTEKQRLDDLSATLNYPNKDTTIASDALKEKFNSNPNTFDNAKLFMYSITEANDEAGTLKVNYHFVSTKDGMNDVVSETYSQEFSGFKIPSKELSNINDLDASFNGDNSKLPSYFDSSTADKTLSTTVDQDPDEIYNRVVKVTEVVNPNDKEGKLIIKYVIVSTNKTDPNETYISNKKEVEVPGFKTEEQRLNELSSEASYPDKENTSPSEIDVNNISFTNNLEDANVELIPDSLVKDDLTNSVTGKYKTTSTKEGAEDVSVEKEFTITNFQSEVERLNKLVNNDQATKTVTYNDASQEKEAIKASEFVAKENLLELINANISTPDSLVNKSKIEINLDDIVINDEDGTITFKYHLVSSKDEFTNADKADKTSTTEENLILDGFLTNLQARKNELINKINELVNSNNEGNSGLIEEQADELINLINSDKTDTIAKVDELEKQADITVIKNDLAKLTHLNSKQRSDADSKISKPDLTAKEAKEIYNSYVEIDAKMEKLGELVDKYNKLISDPNNKKYTSANEETKTQFDNNLNYAKELLKSDKYNGISEDLALEEVPFNLLDKLISDVNTINSLDYDYENLNNNSKFPKELIDNLRYLNEQEKQKYKDAIEPKETYSEGQAIYNYAVIVNNHKNDAINYIDSLKYLNETEKQAFKDKVIVANGEDFDLVDKIKNDVYEADLSVKKLIDAAKGAARLTNDEINQIINNLHNLGVNNPNYDNLDNQLISYNDFADALERYRKDNISSDTFLENERLLKEQIAKLDENHSYNQNNISKAAQALQDRSGLLKKDSQSEINLVHSLLESRETTFKNEISHDNLVNQNRYQNFAKNVVNAKYFKLAIKGKATKEEIQILKSIAKSDASNVIYSALIKKLDAIKVYIPRKVTSFKWWLLVSLTLLTLGFWIFMLGRKKN